MIVKKTLATWLLSFSLRNPFFNKSTLVFLSEFCAPIHIIFSAAIQHRMNKWRGQEFLREGENAWYISVGQGLFFMERIQSIYNTCICTEVNEIVDFQSSKEGHFIQHFPYLRANRRSWRRDQGCLEIKDVLRCLSEKKCLMQFVKSSSWWKSFIFDFQMFHITNIRATCHIICVKV